MAIEALLLAAAVTLVLLALHPFTTYPLSLLLLKRLRRRPPASRGEAPGAPSFTICMCAYNEEKVIRHKALNLLELKAREPTLQILVYVDAATDRTADILREYEPHIDVHVATSRRGKTYGMNLLASRARGSILVFTDANVMLDENCLDALRQDFADPSVGCVCGNLIYTNAGDSVTAATGSLYWRLEERIKVLEQETGSVMGADGSLFAVRRSLHRAPPEHIIDDMYVSFMVLVQGYRIIQSRHARAYEASATSSSEEFRRKSRIACQAFNVHRLIWPHIRKLGALTVYQYVSHKLLRWLSIYFLAAGALALIAAFAASGSIGMAGLLLACMALAYVLGARYSIPPFSQLVDVVSSLAGAGLGVWHSLRGESYQTWTPAASVRSDGRQCERA
ncbi:MAG TPA: glycosyltransferase [Steroidobacter sp.]